MELANGLKRKYVSPTKELEKQFPGVDFNLFERSLLGSDVKEVNGKENVPMFEMKVDLMSRVDEFLRWIQGRKERVIVGKF